jgi:hypothetical protein
VKTVRKFKLWFVWQDEQHQQWLQQQAAQGLHLRDTNIFGLHTFERGAPADIAYRWDVRYMTPDAEYRQLFQDAGWEHVTSSLGWHCWRKPRKAGVATEIFTDSRDRAAKYQRVIRLLAAVMAVEVLTALLLPDSQFFQGMAWGMGVATIVIGGLSLFMLARRVKAVKHA